MTNHRSLDDEVLCLDLQTSGARPPTAQIIEAGYCLYRFGSPSPAVITRLVRLSGAEPLPLAIRRVTGITTELLLEGGITPSQLWDELALLIKGRALPLVIHYAGFETPFLRALAGEDEKWLDIYCTFEMARRLLPALPSRSLRALSGYLGYPIDQPRRSSEHVAATVHIWHQLCVMLGEQHGIKDFEALRCWLQEKAPVGRQKKSYVLTPAVRLALPEAPGIYRFRDAKGRILYIGKAQNLRSRVNSYFRGQRSKGARLNELTSQIAAVDFDQALDPLHACLMENDKIKEHLPPYNRALLYGERNIGFMTADFIPCDAAADAVCYGPFSAFSYAEHMSCWLQLLDNPAALLPETLSGEGLDGPLIAQGVALFRALHGLDEQPLGRGGRRSLLLKMWAEDLQRRREIARLALLAMEQAQTAAATASTLEGSDDPVEEALETVEEDDEALDELEVWDAERFAEHMRRVLVGLTRRIHRGRALRQLTSGRLLFRYPQGPWHILEMRGAQPHFTLSSEPPRPSCPVEQSAPAGSPRFAGMNVLTYDRMVIFYAELRRMLKSCRELTWCRPGGSPWSKAEIEQHLYPGMFPLDLPKP